MTHYTGKTIWIIGASSGIGEALARNLSAQGARLILSARDAGKLTALRSTLSQSTIIMPVDITDHEKITTSAKTIFSQFGRLDSVIVMAAQYDPVEIRDIQSDSLRQIIDTNLIGTFNVVGAVLPYFEKQQGGQIALCGSVAGYRGLPRGQPYSATKAAIMNLAESLRGESLRHNIDVRLISPGFVRTPMTDKNSFKMPMMIEPVKAAEYIAKGLAGHSFEIHFPPRFTWLMKLLRILPSWIYFKIVRI